MKTNWIRVRVKKALNNFGLDLVRLNPIPFDAEEDFKQHYELIKSYTMVSAERCYLVYQLIRHIEKNNIPGAVVECGVWRGGVCMLAALTLKDLNSTRDIYLFDTFTGMAKPGENDITTTGRKAGMEYIGKHAISASIVNDNMASTGYGNFHLVPGMVEETLPGKAPDHIALLRLDTDWYDSTKHELKMLYPRVPAGGRIIIDDYAKWDGAKQAVHEYIESENLNDELIRVSGNRVIFR